MKIALLRLFNAVQVENKTNENIHDAERAIKNGYILDPAIQENNLLLTVIESVVGISGEKANASFHKSWKMIRDASMEQLVIQQIIHYITTYGFERLGIYREDAVYIPSEVLELPDLQDDISLIVIKAMTEDEILEAIVNLGSGIALSQQTLDDIMTIIKAHRYNEKFEEIKNRELKALIYDFYGIVPSEPVEFLRHLIAKLTDESLLIKNDYLIEKIKSSNGKFLDVLLEDPPDDLASIFYRFKPLFLAMKSISRNKTFFNRLRKQARKLHKPMLEDYLNSVTSQIKTRQLDLDILKRKLEKATIFRKIRLAYALKFRLSPSNSIVYQVRNGRGWVDEFEWSDINTTELALDIILVSIADDIHKNVDGKVIYIPSNIHYALPATEKQFTGHFPTGSYATVPENLIVGIHWMNTDKRVDLDLSVIGESGKFGWDTSYRNEERSVLFSGDMTNAPKPNGATELFYIKKQASEARIVIANYFNFSRGDKVDCKILVASEKPESFNTNYMVDVNNIVASPNINITKRQTILGLISANRVYFANVGIGNSITSTNSEQSMRTREYLVSSLINSLDLRDILSMAGAIIVDEKPISPLQYIDLSPEALNKSTIIDLIK